MDASEVLRSAWEAVVAANLPESVQPKAFELAVLHLSGDTATASKRDVEPRRDAKGSGASGGEEKPDPKPKAASDATSSRLLEKLAHEGGVEIGDLEEVIYFDQEGVPHVSGPARKLGSTMSSQARTVAVLVTAARSLALDETVIASKVVRSECALLKCFDTNNFGSHTASAPGVTTIGNGTSRTFKLKPGEAGLKAFREALDTVRGVKAES